jgi:predicted membrane protein DUF2207
MVGAAEKYADAIPWLIVAGAVLAAWLVLFTIVARTTMPRLPEAGPETMDPGPEPPAIANLLVNRCRVTTSALSATLVDLAARGHLAIDRIGDGDELVRLGPVGRDATNSYETLTLDLVRTRARNDTVPASELSLGYGKTADRWWKRFDRAVVDHARELGLVRPRFTRAQVVLLAGTLLAPFLPIAIALEQYGEAARAAGDDFDAGSGFVIAGILWGATLLLGKRILRGWRETPAGAAAAAHWLGLRDFLRRNEAFREKPPAGVAIWNRLLAYGVAVGVAHGTDAALPIGPTRDDEGWSPYQGLWRQVRITYPNRFCYGEAPRRAALMSVVVLAGAAIAGVVVARTFLPAVWDLPSDIADKDGGGRLPVLPVAVIALIPIAFVAMHIVRRIVVLRRALADLGNEETFEGYVVRVPWGWVKRGDDRVWEPTGYTAVDDGRSDEVRALRYYSGSVTEGEVVRVTLTPRMRHVTRVELAQSSGAA